MAHVGLVGDGSTLPLFVVTRDQKLPESVDKNGHFVAVMPHRKGESEDTTLAYLHWAFKEGYLKPGELVLMDASGGHKTEDVTAWLEHKKIHFLIYPPGTGKYLNPCDNSFNADFSRKYHLQMADLVEEKKPTHEERLHIMMDAYQATREEGIIHLFQHCGILHPKPHAVVQHLLNEGYRLSSQYKELHATQLETYNKWCQAHHISHSTPLADLSSLLEKSTPSSSSSTHKRKKGNPK